MGWAAPFPTPGSALVIATMHGKDQVIAPILEQRWNLSARVCARLDTDQFGSFTRDIPRTGSVLDAARAKIAAAFALEPGAELAIASEGSFGPHPQIPFVAQGAETVLFRDRGSDFELIGLDVSTDANFAFRRVTSIDEARAFTNQVGFPEHGVVMLPCDGPEPALGT